MYKVRVHESHIDNQRSNDRQAGRSRIEQVSVAEMEDIEQTRTRYVT